MTVLILQKNRVSATVKVVGTGTQTITLASLALADETTSGATVDIHELYFSTTPDTKITITRNGTDVFALTGTDHWTFNGLAMSENNTFDLVVTSTDTNSTLIIMLRKKTGYVGPNTQGGVIP